MCVGVCGEFKEVTLHCGGGHVEQGDGLFKARVGKRASCKGQNDVRITANDDSEAPALFRKKPSGLRVCVHT